MGWDEYVSTYSGYGVRLRFIKPVPTKEAEELVKQIITSSPVQLEEIEEAREIPHTFGYSMCIEIILMFPGYTCETVDPDGDEYWYQKRRKVTVPSREQIESVNDWLQHAELPNVDTSDCYVVEHNFTRTSVF